MSAQRVLITGGAGFIGSHLSERLLAQGDAVVVLDSFDDFYDPDIKRRNIAGASVHPDYRLVQGDIRDPAALDQAMQGQVPDAVIHLAARAGVRPSIKDPETYTSVNLVGTTSLLEACRRHGVERLLFGSSSSVYGNNRKVPFSEDDPVDHPISPYGATKKAGEVLCHAHHHLFGLNVACLRFFTVYGPRQRPEMAIHKFARLLLDGGEIEQYGDGSSARDYTYVDDIVDGILLALEHCSGYDIWNLGGSRTVSLKRLVELIAEKLGTPARVKVLPAQPGDVDRTWADVTRVKNELNWSAKTRIEQGLDRFIEWLREQK
jgi:UDP-glucuronate 4-epimerase